MPANSTTLLLGTRKGLVILERRGNDWRFVCEAHRGIPISYAAVDPRNGTLWAGLDHGHWGQKLSRSRDMGASWDEVPAPKYPEGEEIRDGKPATLSYIWYITPGGADQPKRLYLGTEPGGLFQSDDGGETFELVRGLWDHPSRKEHWFGGGRDHPGACSIVVDPRDSQHIIVGISVGGVFETHDGGKTWCGRNKGLWADFLPDGYAEYGHDPHFILASPANPDVLWQQNHCGVFRSTDSAQTWENISQKGGPVYFGFAVAADEHDPDTAWVVPAIDAQYRLAVDHALRVCRTTDGGKTWKALRNGLPQENTYDLVFRHALDLSGDTLAFGTTTGNLYVSDDRGDTWRCIGHNFAPISSVRFVDV
jgi:photosystem II stability/assembly factor-like uncharacterized protein